MSDIAKPARDHSDVNTAPSQRVSVALCTCEGARFIADQIESICRQTMPPAEIVLHDDASCDDTIARAQAAWRRCLDRRPDGTPELKIAVHEQRLGVARNFSSALAACTHEFIALSDQDDVWHPKRLERMVLRMEARPSLLLLHGNARLVDAEGRSLGGTLFEALDVSAKELEAIAGGVAFKVLLDRNLVTGATTLLRRRLLESAFPIPPHWIHDEWLGMLAAALGGLDVEKEPLLDYRQHGANQIGAQRERFLDAAGRAMASRGEWHTRRLLRAQELEARLEALPSVPPLVLGMVREKVAHHRARAALPQARIRRLPLVFREWKTGRYRRYGRGLRGVIKDLLERA